jgi:hypothetical protein
LATINVGDLSYIQQILFNITSNGATVSGRGESR